MVFCGKPSKACCSCRRRRIKCDLREPACSQCVRADQKCSGYRDPVALLFRDENSKVIQKSRAISNPQMVKYNARSKGSNSKLGPKSSDTIVKSPTSSASSTPDSIPHARTPSSSPVSSACTSLPPIISLPWLEDHGVKFFFATYATKFPQFLQPGEAPNWAQFLSNATVFDAISSVGYAGLSNVTKDENHKVIARNKYTTLLGRTLEALRQPIISDLENTFRAVLMLAAFEIVLGDGGDKDTWAIHIEGGAALLRAINSQTMKKVQGGHPVILDENCQSLTLKSGRQVQFYFSVLMKCLRQCQPAPPYIAEWYKEYRKFVTHSRLLPAIDLIERCCRFINLYSTLKTSYSENPGKVYNEVLDIEIELLLWRTQLPEDWTFTVLPAPTEENPTEVYFHGQFHRYLNAGNARLWNHYRWFRILVNEIIVLHISKQPSISMEAKLQRAQSLEIISQSASEICTSIASQFAQPPTGDLSMKNEPPINSSFIVLFPLAVAAGAVGISQETHNWAVGALQRIATTMGIGQALKLLMMAKKHREHWQSGNIDNDLSVFSLT